MKGKFAAACMAAAVAGMAAAVAHASQERGPVSRERRLSLWCDFPPRQGGGSLFSGFGRGSPTPSRRVRVNVKHAKRRARHARRK